MNIELDTDGDGKPDTTLRDEPRFDLRLKHRVDTSVVSVSTTVIEPGDTAVDLQVWMRNHVSALSGTIYDDGIARRLTTRLRNEGRLRVSGYEAYECRLDVIDVDKHAVTPGVVDAQVHYILARTPYWRSNGGRRQPIHFPVLMLLTFASRPETFATHEAEFDWLAGAMRFGTAPPGIVREAADPRPGIGPPAASPTSPSAAPAAASMRL